MAGLPRLAISAVSSRATRRPEIDHMEDAKAPTTSELIVDKVERPARVRLRLDEDRRPGPHRAPSCSPLPYRQPFLAVEPIDAADARRLSLPAQQDEETAVSKTAPLGGEQSSTLAKRRVGRPTGAVTDHRPIRRDDGAGPPLRKAERDLQVRDGFALGGGPYHFFASSSV